MHASTLVLQGSCQYLRYGVICGNVVEVKCTLRVTLSHLNIGTKDVNDIREMRHHLKSLLVMIWTVATDPVSNLVW